MGPVPRAAIQPRVTHMRVALDVLPWAAFKVYELGSVRGRHLVEASFDNPDLAIQDWIVGAAAANFGCPQGVVCVGRV